MKTYIETYDWDKYTINMDYLVFCNMELEKKKLWEEYLRLLDYNTSIKWNSIKKTSWSKLYMWIDENESDNILKLERWKVIERTPEERKAMADKLRKLAWITFEDRKKKFYQKRLDILAQLAKEEEYFELETTISKVERLQKLDLDNLKKIQNNDNTKRYMNQEF